MRPMPADSTPVMDEMRKVALGLTQALVALRVIHDQVDEIDRDTVRELRWTIAEAQRINRQFHRRLADRLAGPTPGSRSQPTSLHQPPDACPEERTPP